MECFTRKMERRQQVHYKFCFSGRSYIVSGSQKTVKKEVVIYENLKVVSNLFNRAFNIEEAV